MSVEDRGARPTTARERRALDEIERNLGPDPGLRAALRDGVPGDRTPRPGLLALLLALGCALITTTALTLGPGYALGVAAGGLLVLLGVLARAVRRR